MNKFIKRVVATLAVLPLALSSPISSLAETTGGANYVPVDNNGNTDGGKDNIDSNGTGGGVHTGPSTVERVAVSHSWHENNGFRCYIVNNEGVPISNLVDFVNYYPWDMNMLKAASNWELEHVPGAREGVDTYFNRTGMFPNEGGDVYKKIVYLSGAKTDPVYVRTSNGKVFKDGHYPEGTSGVKSVMRQSFTKGSDTKDNISLVEGKMYLISDLQKALEQRITKNGYSSPFSGNFDSRAEVTYELEVDGVKKEFVMLDYIPSGVTSIRGALVLTGTYMRNLMMRPVSIENYEKDQRLIINLFVELELPKVNGLGSVEGGNEPIFEILDPEIKKYYEDAKTRHNSLSEEEKKSAKSPMIDTLQHYQAKLAFEPIAWAVPGVMGDPNAPKQLQTLQPDPLYNISLRPGAQELDHGISWWSPDSIIYGTVTGEAQYLSYIINQTAKQQMGSSVPDCETNFDAWIQWLLDYQIMAGACNMLPERTYRLEKEEFGLAAFEDHPLWLCDKAGKWNTSGYGIMYFGMGLDDIITQTWDQPNYPPNNYKPGPSPENSNPDGSPKLPEYPSEGDKYKEKGTDHKFNIVKFYAEKNPDGTYTYTENHTREQAIHTIQINDEPGYVVDNYYTSPTFTKPTNKTDSYDDWKNSKAPKGGTSKGGTKAEKVKISADEPDTTLYIRLVGNPKLVIVKYFPDGSTKEEEVPWVPNYDSSEPGYEYEKDKQNPDKPDTIPSTYDSTTGTPGSNPTITVDPSTKIIYIKYKDVPKSDAPLVLHQNELAHTFTLADIQDLVELKHNFEDKYSTGSKTCQCDGCEWDSDSHSWWCPGHDCSWVRLIEDGNYSYVIENKQDYGSTTFVGSQGAFKSEETGTVNDSGSLGIHGGNTNGLKPNLKFSIYRDKSKDNVTLYPTKNGGVKGELSQIYITKEGYTPQTTRVRESGQAEWYSTFKVNYQYTTEDNTLTWTSTYCGCDNHSCIHDEGSWDGTPHPDLGTINSPYSKGNNVLTRAYLGQPGIGEQRTTLSSSPFSIFSKNFNKNLRFYPGNGLGKFGNDGKFFEFYPYIEMTYQTVQDLSNKLAYITSTNLSKVLNNTTVEVGVYQSKSGYGINLTSEQWSTHARTIEALSRLGIQRGLINQSLIPGGAVIKLSTPDDGNTPQVWVGFRAYEMSISDDLKVSLSKLDGIKTTTEAKVAADKFYNEVRESLSNYHVEKWIKEGITTREI